MNRERRAESEREGPDSREGKEGKNLQKRRQWRLFSHRTHKLTLSRNSLFTGGRLAFYLNVVLALLLVLLSSNAFAFAAKLRGDRKRQRPINRRKEKKKKQRQRLSSVPLPPNR